MKFPKIFALISLCLIFLACNSAHNENSAFIDYVVDPREAEIELFLKDSEGNMMRSFQMLKNHIEKNGKKLRFAMNGGMYQENGKPVGLFIQKGQTVAPLNTREAKGNFYLKPNGVFYLTKEKQAFVVNTEDLTDDGNIEFATQSGPMLLFDGKIHPEFVEGSDNLNIRNGVCVLANNKIVFSISKQEVNFYDFAKHFFDLGCKDALFLDGFVSRIYLPEQGIEDLSGNFGVMIGVVENK